MRIAQILNEKCHWIFEANSMPSFPPDPYGNPIILVDITDKPEVCEGWDYDSATGEFTESAPPEPLPPPDPTQSDRIEANTDYIVMMLG